MNREIQLHVRAMTRATYVIVDEEDRFIVKMSEVLSKHLASTHVYNAAVGLVPIQKYTEDWQKKKHEPGAQSSIHDALIQIYKEPSTSNNRSYYIITDPERWLKDDHVVRRVLNILHQGHQDISVTKCLFFVGHRRYIPEKLQRYIEVVDATKITSEEIDEIVTDLASKLETKAPENAQLLFNGMTTFEIEASMTQAVVDSRLRDKGREIDPKYISEYKKSQIKKTDLLQLVNVKNKTFQSIGGAQRFKSWAKKQKATWTEEGRKFGLTPPRGVLFVGVYGCGKSLSAQALASEWQLPLVQFEMGKIRTSAVGESEANLYRALRIVDSIAPCIMWIDEAEKSLAGAASSSQSDAGTTARLLGILSTWTQESEVPVCMVMTTNSLKNVPPEMVNRMPERFFFDLPSEEDRIDIIKIHAKAQNQDVSKFNLATLAERSKNLVGREIDQAIKAAMVESFDQKKPGLDEAILAKELERKPRIITTMGDEVKEILEWVGYDPDVDDGVRAKLASDRRSEHFVNIKKVESV
jgi:SpoVK/Ycf46/Vps4 family AAA+-type ATPase